MTATVLDDRRRLVMPAQFPARAAVTVQRIDEDTVIVKRQREQTDFAVIVVPIIKHLPDDPEMDAKAEALARRAFKHLPPFEE